MKSDYTYNIFSFVKAAVYPGHYEMSWECFQLQIKRIDCSPSTKPTFTTKEQKFTNIEGEYTVQLADRHLVNCELNCVKFK